MVFIDYSLILIYTIPIVAILLGIGAYWKLRDTRRSLIRTIARFGAIGVASIGCLVLLLVFCVGRLTATVRSAPAFSADHKSAVRVIDDDYGATGGDTSVTIYTNYGLRSRDVLNGDWKIVEAQDVHWLNNSELLIEYPTDTGYARPVCNNLDNIKVTCRPSARRALRN